MGLTLSIENNSVVVDISNYVPKDYLANEGRSGFGVAPTTLDLRQRATQGSKWRRTRRESRTLILPLTIHGDGTEAGAAQIEAKMNALVAVLADDFSSAQLVQTYSSGMRWATEVHYSSGADLQFGIDTDGRNYARWTLNLVAPDAYWTAQDALNISAGGAAPATNGLLPMLSRLQLSADNTIGLLAINNPGDVPAQPVWYITGPGTTFTATAADGSSFKYNAAIASGQTIIVDTIHKTITDAATGVNKYDQMGSVPKLFTIPKGLSDITMAMPGNTTDSIVRLNFRPRRELIFA